MTHHDKLKNDARKVLGYSPTVVNFDPLEDPATIPAMLEYLKDSQFINQLGGQAQLWYSLTFGSWVVSWTFRDDLYQSMRQGQTPNEALCAAVVAVGRKAGIFLESEVHTNGQ